MRLTPSHQTPLRITRKRLGRCASLRPEVGYPKKRKKSRGLGRISKRDAGFTDGPESSRKSEEQCWLQATLSIRQRMR